MEDYALVTTHCVVGDGVEASNLYRVVSAIAEGRVPPAARPFFAGGRLIGILKPNGSTRPKVIGESLRRLILNPTSPTGALFRTPPVPCDFLVIRALALPSAELPGYRPQIPRPRRRHLVHEFSGFKFVLQKR